MIELLKLDIADNIIRLKGITHTQLPEILNWYNNTEQFKYATGIDKPVSMDYLLRKYEEAAICGVEFFAGIYGNHGKMIGLVKGRVGRKSVPAIWINSIIISPSDQRKGIGSLTVKLLIEGLNKSGEYKKVCVSVVEKNTAGLRFWIKNGFRCVRRIEKHITLDNIKHDVTIMSKDI